MYQSYLDFSPFASLRAFFAQFGCAVEVGKKRHENLANMTCKGKMTTGESGAILPSLEERRELAMRDATKRRDKERPHL